MSKLLNRGYRSMKQKIHPIITFYCDFFCGRDQLRQSRSILGRFLCEIYVSGDEGKIRVGPRLCASHSAAPKKRLGWLVQCGAVAGGSSWGVLPVIRWLAQG